MLDIIIHKEDSFVLPKEQTEDENIQLAQAYISIFLTLLGSVEQYPELGVDFSIGSRNNNRFRFLANRINDDIFALMKEPYNLTRIEILSIEDSTDSDIVEMSVRLEKASTSTTVDLTI